jgi:glyoxylase-like metal-dependent hydrolase (beta-lactamase superfamily II)
MKMDGGVVFGQVPKGLWQDWAPADRRNRVKIGLNCMLVSVGDHNYLIDTGAGPKMSPDLRDVYGVTTSQLLPSLRKLGCLPPDIHGVVLTSLHFEHTGNCTKVERSGGLTPTFPKARYFVQRSALEEAMSPNERDAEGYVPDDYLPLFEKGQLELLDAESTIAPGISVRQTGGPTNGHQIVIVSHGGERVAFLGDLVPTPFHLQLACISASDRRPEETLEAKRQILSEALSEGWLLVFSHGIGERAGYLERRNGRPYLRPVQLN